MVTKGSEGRRSKIGRLASPEMSSQRPGNLYAIAMLNQLNVHSFICFHRVDTTERLKALREEMRTLRLDAFLVPSGDSHQSEYVAKADKRRQWIGGFSGSSGFAAITLEKAAMWADGRYTYRHTYACQVTRKLCSQIFPPSGRSTRLQLAVYEGRRGRRPCVVRMAFPRAVSDTSKSFLFLFRE